MLSFSITVEEIEISKIIANAPLKSTEAKAISAYFKARAAFQQNNSHVVTEHFKQRNSPSSLQIVGAPLRQGFKACHHKKVDGTRVTVTQGGVAYSSAHYDTPRVSAGMPVLIP